MAGEKFKHLRFDPDREGPESRDRLRAVSGRLTQGSDERKRGDEIAAGMIAVCNELDLSQYIRRRKSGELSIKPEDLRINPQYSEPHNREPTFYSRSYGGPTSPKSSSTASFVMDAGLGFSLEYQYAPNKWYPLGFIAFNLPEDKNHIVIEQFQGGTGENQLTPRFFRQKLYSVNHRDLLLDLVLRLGAKVGIHDIGIRDSKSSVYDTVHEAAVERSDGKHTTYDSYAETKGFEYRSDLPGTHRWKKINSR